MEPERRHQVEHGDVIARGASVNFSVNLNHYGPDAVVLRAVAAADIINYPDSTCRAAREAWARQLGTDPECVLIGPGAANLIWLVVQRFATPGTKVGLLSPTFGEAAAAAIAHGREVVEAPIARDSMRHDLDACARTLRGCGVIYLCTPNNPTGTHIAASEIEAFARALPESLLVVDQSFLGLSSHAAELVHRFPRNVLCVRSLTKEHAVAGLRVGYAWGVGSLIDALARIQPPWSTPAPAQEVARVAASLGDFVEMSWRRLRFDRDELVAGLRRLGLEPMPSETTYFAVPVQGATRLTRHLLLEHGIAVRDCTSFGLPEHIRLAARPEPCRLRLIEALSTSL